MIAIVWFAAVLILGFVGAWGVRQDARRREVRAWVRLTESERMALIAENIRRVGEAMTTLTTSTVLATASLTQFGNAISVAFADEIAVRSPGATLA